jgi:hypothetical protein
MPQRVHERPEACARLLPKGSSSSRTLGLRARGRPRSMLRLTPTPPPSITTHQLLIITQASLPGRRGTMAVEALPSCTILPMERTRRTKSPPTNPDILSRCLSGRWRRLAMRPTSSIRHASSVKWRKQVGNRCHPAVSPALSPNVPMTNRSQPATTDRTSTHDV